MDRSTFLTCEAHADSVALLARVSSRASGFFFCGMMELPVHSSSGSLKYPNSGSENKIRS